MSKGNKLLVSDELLAFLTKDGRDDAVAGRVIVALARYWAGGCKERPAGSDDLTDIFFGQLDAFWKECERKRKANAEKQRRHRCNRLSPDVTVTEGDNGYTRLRKVTTVTEGDKPLSPLRTVTDGDKPLSPTKPIQYKPTQPTTTTASGVGVAGEVAVVVAGSEEGFEAFWSAYPKKQNRDQALAAWRNAQVFAGWPGAAAVVAAVEMMKRDPLWNREDGRFIPNPSTFLADRRWTDQPTLTPTAERAAATADVDRREAVRVTDMPIRSLCRLLTTDKAFDRPAWEPGQKEALMRRMKELGIERLSDIDGKWHDITVNEFITNTYKPERRMG